MLQNNNNNNDNNNDNNKNRKAIAIPNKTSNETFVPISP